MKNITEQFETIVRLLTKPKKDVGDGFSICDPAEQFESDKSDSNSIARSLNAAFLIALAGKRHPLFNEANNFLRSKLDSSEWSNVAQFYLNGVDIILGEINDMCGCDSEFNDRLISLYDWLSSSDGRDDDKGTVEKIWSLFFPEATGINNGKEERIEALRGERLVSISELNSNPISDPAQQILFTSNILLTVPAASKSIDKLAFSADLRESLVNASAEQQLFWYDHPVQIGVESDKNEILYGLRSLDEALEFETARGNRAADIKLNCVLSASVTHRSLQKIARKYIEEEFLHAGALKNINVYVFTELETQRIIDEILAPSACHYFGIEDGAELFNMFGVDGEYGRHYSFLKAIAAFWQTFYKPETKATFKFDLDQVFPQDMLVEQSGASAFEHLKTDLWGAKGVGSNGQPVELGMIAGALVNQRDIEHSIFTPDVPFPNRKLAPDEHIFFSILPQALSTESEMMTRYTTDNFDGKKRCIQRVHVTGGTNGILIDMLYRYRPFTPSFIGRAEDQAYILSVLANSDGNKSDGNKLGYVHKDGLIMRHDKEGFAQEAIEFAYIGKLLGDYVRILYFSAYARALTKDVEKLKESIHPFTGCFISKIPSTVVYLRFALKAWSFFNDGKDKFGFEFITSGAQRISNTLNLANDKDKPIEKIYDKERRGWKAFYDTLFAIKDALNRNDDFAVDLRKKAQCIVEQSFISFASDKVK